MTSSTHATPGTGYRQLRARSVNNSIDEEISASFTTLQRGYLYGWGAEEFLEEP